MRRDEGIGNAILAFMVYVLGIIVGTFGVLVAFGAVTGRIKIKGCCAAADPRLDLRMRSAFEDEHEPGNPTDDLNPSRRCGLSIT